MQGLGGLEKAPKALRLPCPLCVPLLQPQLIGYILSFGPWQLLASWLGTMTHSPGAISQTDVSLGALEAKHAEKDAERD